MYQYHRTCFKLISSEAFVKQFKEIFILPKKIAFQTSVFYSARNFSLRKLVYTSSFTDVVYS